MYSEFMMHGQKNIKFKKYINLGRKHPKKIDNLEDAHSDKRIK